MLFNLHVKNLALIDEAEVFFGDGLNILTGETGAGKSIIIGSINIALGQKFTKEMLRKPEEDALVELVFEIDNHVQRKALSALGVDVTDDQVTLMRRMVGGRAIAKINGEASSVTQLKKVAEVLLDIHGQHEHQSLLYKKKHLEILDEYGKSEIMPLMEETARLFFAYQDTIKRIDMFRIDEEQRQRELSILEYEINEIETANLMPGEDEQLESRYKILANGKAIMEAVGTAHYLTGYEGEYAAGDAIGRAARELSSVRMYDTKLEFLARQIEDIDALLNDFNRELSAYEQSQSFGDGEFFEVEQRLNEVNRIKAKYGRTIQDVDAYLEDRLNRYEALKNYEETLCKMEAVVREVLDEYHKAAAALTAARQKYAELLTKEITETLIDLNFLQVNFEIQMRNKEKISTSGVDDVEFFISTNPGEPVRPLGAVASGGELSRIMLAIKTVLAEKDAVGTMIFDEIDVGISGRTAQMVSEKMARIARTHQVICITHLPQIAAMADHHFLIEKSIQNDATVTGLSKLEEGQMITELARMLGGAEITDTVLKSATEMKTLANQKKCE